MARWRQEMQEDGTSRMVPIDEAAIQRDGGFAIHGIFKPFRSTIDGTEISTNKQLREHNKRNGVVQADEFTPEFYAGKAKERADFYQGRHSRGESLKRKQEIYENIMRAEREHGK